MSCQIAERATRFELLRPTGRRRSAHPRERFVSSTAGAILRAFMAHRSSTPSSFVIAWGLALAISSSGLLTRFATHIEQSAFALKAGDSVINRSGTFRFVRTSLSPSWGVTSDTLTSDDVRRLLFITSTGPARL